MKPIRLGAIAALAVVLSTAAAAEKKEFRYSVAPGAMVTIRNQFGSVTVRGAASRQVVISATTASDKVEVDSSQSGNRIVARSNMLQRAGEAEARVDYEVSVPQDSTVTVNAATGPIHAERLRGDLTIEGDTAQVEVREISNAHVHVRTVSGPVTLTNISNGHVEISSVGGNVQLTSVSGPKISVNTTKGSIRYRGDFSGGGDYLLNNHSGDIDVFLPTTASVDITARSVNGTVEQDFPLQQKQHLLFQQTPGRSFAGTSNSGGSSVQLRSFSGKIRVKKQ